MNKLLYLLLLALLPSIARAQECQDKLQEAKRAYFNGNFEQVNSSLEDCYQSGLEGEEKKEALELLVNANLVLDNNQSADNYMQELLKEYPLYQPRSTDLVEFQELYKSYEIRTKWNLGFVAGINIPDFQVMQYRSLASITEETSGYEGDIGASLGLKAEWMVWKKLFLSGSVLYQQFGYSQKERIMTFQDVFIAEKLNFVSVPVMIGYEFFKSDFKVFIQGGISPHFLLSSKANLELFGVDPDQRTPLTGIPRKTEGYDLTDQRKQVTLSYVAGAGFRKSFGLYAVELAFHYEFGLNNLVKEEQRFQDTQLWRTYSYVPDDFKVDNVRIALGVVKSFVYPKKLEK